MIENLAYMYGPRVHTPAQGRRRRADERQRSAPAIDITTFAAAVRTGLHGASIARRVLKIGKHAGGKRVPT